MEIDYEEIALIQLHKAIELFYEENYICAITLAGAAEEILGKLLEFSKNKKPILKELKIKISDQIPDVKEKEVATKLNNTRNMLKHLKLDGELNFKPVDDAVMIIARAISNYVYLTNKKTEKIDRFASDDSVVSILDSWS